MTEIKDLGELFEMMAKDDDRLPSWDKLPVFGGDEPADTGYGPVWSWDKEDLIIGESLAELEIISREEYAAMRAA